MEKHTSKPRTRRGYTDAEKQAILADVALLGVTAAAAKHGAPPSTLYLWKAAQAKTAPVDHPSPAPELPGEAPTPVSSPAVARPPSTTPIVAPTPASKTVVKRYTPSQKAQAVELANTRGVSEAAKALGISRFSLYDWQRKVAAAAKGEGESITTGPAPAEIEAQRDAEILGEYSRHPGLGPSQIRNQLRRKNIKVSVHTVRRVMEGAGYRPPKVERRPHDRRYEAVRPNHLWHLDFVQRYINRANTFTLILIDDRSRFVVGHGVDDAERADMVLETFEQAVLLHGKPEMVMHDRGSAFWSWRGISRFSKLLAELGIDQVVAEQKETNGKVEVFNGNLAKELFNAHRFYDLAEMKRRLATHLHWYNHGRTHHAHGGLLVPADHYYGRADEVLARIESGQGKEGDELGLRDRRLSLFSITSENGELVVSLMGQRLSLGAHLNV